MRHSLSVLLTLGFSWLSGCGQESVPRAGSVESVNMPWRDCSPRWSPDGNRIAFLRVFGAWRTQLWVADASLGNARAITDVDFVTWARPPIFGRTAPAAPDAPAWSPDGRRIAVSRGASVAFDSRREIGGADIWTVDVDSGRLAPLAIHPDKYDGDLQFFRAPAWSPTGRHVAYLAEGVYGYSSLVVHTLGATVSNDQAIPVDMLDDYGWPAWSPDGRWLAFRQSLFRSESALPVESIRMIAPGTARSRTLIIKSLTENELMRASHVSWSPDSLYISAREYAPGSTKPAALVVFDATTGRRVSTGNWREDIKSGNWSGPMGKQQDLYGVAKHSENGVILFGGGPRWEGWALPSDDFDFSPDGLKIVVHDPKQKEPAARTTLRVLSHSDH